ncbi:MAG: TIGR00730 family Rossman fold protein [Desulfovibrio sp.]|nr:TIGR00730 family Rossman fold protein [Desulfovibrio sp.]
MQNICVFLGSCPGDDPDFVARTQELARTIAQRGMTLVYGGSNVGCMGKLADAALAEGGHVVGVIPTVLRDKEIAHTGLSELHVVDGMMERKHLMMSMSDAFISIPGGLGTMDEFFEALTWTQLSLHAKPNGLLNVNGYYDHLLAFLSQAADHGFIRPQHRNMWLLDENPDALLDKMKDWKPIVGGKWVERPDLD